MSSIKVAKRKDGAGRLVRCSVCGHDWLVEPSLVAITLQPNARPPVCNVRIYLEMARRHAHHAEISFRFAVERFLKGTARKEGVDVDRVWKTRPPVEEED